MHIHMGKRMAAERKKQVPQACICDVVAVTQA
jgi:hypothetical protein